MGNGRAISVLAAREGAAVVCADVNEAAASETAALVKDEGATAHVVVGDVRSDADCERIVAEANDAVGGICALV